MNERIIETSLGPVLLFRDLDADQRDVLVIQAWLDDGNVQCRTTLELSSAERVRQIIAGYTEEQADRYITNYQNLTI